MRIVQMTLDDDLVDAVDRAVRKLNTSRSAFAREALRKALERLRTADLERKHRRGYEQHPVVDGEFSAWEEAQDWGDR